MSAVRLRAYGQRAALRRGTMRSLARLAQAGERIRRKPRSAEEQRLLLMMARSSVRQRAESGRLVRIAPREYELRSVPARRF